MCLNTKSSEPTSCGGHCESCSLLELATPPARVRREIALTAFRVFVLPFCAGVLGATFVAPRESLQLLAGVAAFTCCSLATRIAPGGRLS